MEMFIWRSATCLMICPSKASFHPHQFLLKLNCRYILSILAHSFHHSFLSITHSFHSFHSFVCRNSQMSLVSLSPAYSVRLNRSPHSRWRDRFVIARSSHWLWFAHPLFVSIHTPMFFFFNSSSSITIILWHIISNRSPSPRWLGITSSGFSTDFNHHLFQNHNLR